MALKLYTTEGNSRAFKTLIAAAYNGVEIEIVPVEMGKTNKTPEFLALNPNGKIPTLQTPEGGIWESNSIARYVARLADKGLFGRNAFEAAEVDQWLDWVRGDLEIAGGVWLYPIFGYLPNNPQATEAAKADIAKALGILNNHLKTRTFLVGERITLADIVVETTLLNFYKNVFDEKYRKPFQNVNRWFNTLINQPNFIKVQGTVTLAVKMAVAPESAPVAAPAPAAAPKAEAPKEEADDEAPQPKKKNPLDSLPPSTFSIDAWKVEYSNNPDTRKALEWFWQNFDPQGWSLWFSEYKYPKELQKKFMSLNLMGGFLQRLDELRKYGMGTLLLFGEDNDGEIGGAWIVRGSELPPAVTECPDYPSYEFKRVDINDPEQKQLFDNLMAWDGDFKRSLKFVDGKVFK